MSYQIKSTPFFRRMVSTSKKNGQLQKLKEEYERIKEFNDRTIEMKMRQVRLKRLFREIEEIKESSSQWKRRRVTAERTKTNEELRVETLVKAKELGKEYSKMNALVDRCTSRIETASSGGTIVPSNIFSRMDVARKERTEKRLSYGNEKSRNNIQKIALNARKTAPRPEIQQEKLRKQMKEKLKQRLSYGNSRSSRNLAKIPKKNAQHKVAMDIARGSSGSYITAAMSQKKLELASVTEHASRPPAKPMPLLMQQQMQSAMAATAAAEAAAISSSNSVQLYKTFEDLQLSKIKMKLDAPARQQKSEEDMHLRARKRWRKIALMVRCRFDNLLRRNHKPLEHEHEPEVMFDEFKLRGISNDTDLPMSQLNERVEFADSESDALPGEVLLNVEPLTDDGMTPPNNDGELESDDAAPDLRHKVQQYVKIYEPIVRDVAQKEVFEFGVHRLRSIFEHQNTE